MRDPTYAESAPVGGAPAVTSDDAAAKRAPQISIPAHLTPDQRRRIAAVELALHRMLYDGWHPAPVYLRHLAGELVAVAVEVGE